LYFGRNSLSASREVVWGGGTGCWTQIIANIKKTGAQNVVLMTDGDMEKQAAAFGGTKVNGGVWFIWGLGGNEYDWYGNIIGKKHGPGYDQIGEAIPKALVGKQGNKHYSFDVQEK